MNEQEENTLFKKNVGKGVVECFGSRIGRY